MTSQNHPGQVLARQRRAALDQVTALERELTGIMTAASQANADDEHDPEGATIAFERQHVAALLEQARDSLAQVNAAIERVATGRYGVCDRCGQPIDPARLQARPAAAQCIGCAAQSRR